MSTLQYPELSESQLQPPVLPPAGATLASLPADRRVQTQAHPESCQVTYHHRSPRTLPVLPRLHEHHVCEIITLARHSSEFKMVDGKEFVKAHALSDILSSSIFPERAQRVMPLHVYLPSMRSCGTRAIHPIHVFEELHKKKGMYSMLKSRTSSVLTFSTNA